jgi:uncharacterized protein (DUF433 family)
MQLGEYFDFQSADDIRIRGHRIGIESVLYECIHRSRTPEQISERFETLSLDDIHATILYYLRNRETVSDYLARWLAYGEQARAVQEQDPGFRHLRDRLQQARAARLAREAAGVSAS